MNVCEYEKKSSYVVFCLVMSFYCATSIVITTYQTGDRIQLANQIKCHVMNIFLLEDGHLIGKYVEDTHKCNV